MRKCPGRGVNLANFEEICEVDDYQGSIATSTRFDYFPYKVTDNDNKKNAIELIEVWKPRIEAVDGRKRVRTLK